MMTDENVPDSKALNAGNTPEPADKKGQMLVIYLPEGSVIVDRTEIDLAQVPKVITEPAPAVITEPAPTVITEPAPAVITERPPAESPISNVPETMVPAVISQDTLEEIVQRAVKEALGTSGGPVPAPLTPLTPRGPRRRAVAVEAYPQSPRSGRRRLRRHLDWVHGINIMLVTYLLLVTSVPALLSSAFGMTMYASKITHTEVQIAAGDLMVTKKLPASQLKPNDVFLVREGGSWRLDARLVKTITTDGTNSTITTAVETGSSVAPTYILQNNSLAYEVTRVIPKLGYVPIVLSSTIVKVGGTLFILIFNLVFHYRRVHRRRLGRRIP